MQQRESAKKAAASAAAANASAQSGRGHGVIQGVPVALLSSSHGPVAGPLLQQNAVTQAASWLDRANALLKGTTVENKSPANMTALSDPSIDAMPNSEIENQMKEVQRLIYEGPLIQQTSASIPQLLQNGQAASTASGIGMLSSDHGMNAEPADKRMRTAAHSGAEDAEALVGFLRSVRASAAAGQEL